MKIVAEVANSHAGDFEYLDRLVEEVAKHGFRYIKFQIYSAEELLHSKHPRFDHFRSQTFGLEKWRMITLKARALGLEPMADIFGLDSLRVSQELGINLLKIPSANRIFSSKFEEALRETKLNEILFSTTGLTFYEITRKLQSLKCILDRDIPVTIIHGHQEFPTPVENTNIEYLRKLFTKFENSVSIGFADHTQPDRDGIYSACLVAMGAGASYFEKHVSLEREITKVDFQSSLQPYQFELFVNTLEQSKSLMNPNTESELIGIKSYLASMRKYPVLKSSIPPGNQINVEDFDYLRIENSDGVIPRIRGGETLRTSKEKNTSLRFEDLSHGVVAVVLCRSGSKRLPNKALRTINNVVPIFHLLSRANRIKGIDKLVLATTNGVEDDQLSEAVTHQGFLVYRGSEEDVLGRMLEAARPFKPNHIMRITGDDILLSIDDVEDAIKEHIMSESHYTNMLTIPSGTEAEIFDFEFLTDFYNSRFLEWDTEYLTNCLNEISDDEFRTHHYESNTNRNRPWRLTLDTEADSQVLKVIFDRLNHEGKIHSYNLDDIVRIIESDEEILAVVRGTSKRSHTLPTKNRYIRWNLS